MKNKVMFVHGNSDILGGQELSLLYRIRGLRERGFYSIVVLSEKGVFSDLLQENNIDVRFIELHRLCKKNPFLYFKTVFNILRLIKKENINIVHTSGVYPVQYCLPAARLVKVPCVVNVNTTIYTKKDLIMSFVKFADKILAISKSVKADLIKKTRCNEDKIQLLYNPVLENNHFNITKDFNEIKRLKQILGINPSTRIVGCVAQIVPWKNLECFIKMARIIKERVKNVKFMIVGESPIGYEKYKESIKVFTEENGLKDDVFFVGFQREINKFIGIFDVSVNCSLVDGGPRTVVESMALGKPVLSTVVGYVPEIIEHNINGYLFPVNKPELMAAVAVDLLNNKMKREKIGRKAKRTVPQEFKIEHHCTLLSRFYYSLLTKKNRKYLLFYEVSSGFGGSANALVNLINNLDKDKICPIVATTNLGEKIKEIKHIDVVRIKGYEERGTLSASKFLFRLMTGIIPEVIRICFIIKRMKVSIVHINTNIMLGIPAIIASKITKIPCVCHIRETRRLIKRERFFAKWVDKFIVLNGDAYNLYKVDIPESKLEIVYDGINVNNYLVYEFKDLQVREECNLDSRPLVGTVGRIVEGKGQKEFVLIAEEIIKSKPRVKFMIVGDAKGDNDKYYRELKELVKREDLDKNVIFTGWRNDVDSFLSSLDIFVFTSTTFPEGLPNIILEAMALKKPVVATDIPGPRDIVIDGETGFLVPPGDIETMARKIIYLLDNPDIAKKMGEAGRRRVEEHFDIKKQVKKIEKIYDGVLSRK